MNRSSLEINTAQPKSQWEEWLETHCFFCGGTLPYHNGDCEGADPDDEIIPQSQLDYFKQAQMASPAKVIASWSVRRKDGLTVRNQKRLRVELRQGRTRYQLVALDAPYTGSGNSLLKTREILGGPDSNVAIAWADRQIRVNWPAFRYTITREGAEGTTGQTRVDPQAMEAYFKQAMPAHWGREAIDDLPQHEGLTDNDVKATYDELFAHLPTLPKPTNDDGSLRDEADLHLNVMEHAIWNDDQSRWHEFTHGTPNTSGGNVPDVFSVFRWMTMFRDPQTKAKRLLIVSDTDVSADGNAPRPTVLTASGQDTGRAIGTAWDAFCQEHELDTATYVQGVSTGPGAVGQIVERYLADGAQVFDVRFGSLPEYIQTSDGQRVRAETFYDDLWDEIMGTGNYRYTDNAGKYPETRTSFIPEEKKDRAKASQPPAVDITSEIERYVSWKKKQGKVIDLAEFKRWINRTKRGILGGGSLPPIPDPDNEYGYYVVLPGMTGPQSSVPRNVIHSQYDVRYHGTVPYQMESRKAKLDSLIHLVGDMQRVFTSPHKFYQDKFHDGRGLTWDDAVHWLFYGAYPKFKTFKEAEDFLRYRIVQEAEQPLGVTVTKPGKQPEPMQTSLADELGD